MATIGTTTVVCPFCCERFEVRILSRIAAVSPASSMTLNIQPDPTSIAEHLRVCTPCDPGDGGLPLSEAV